MKFSLFILPVILTVLALPAPATSIIFASGVQRIGSDNAEINVRAQFDIDNIAKTVTVYLLNLESNPAGITSVLGSIRFNISGAGLNPTPVLGAYSIGTFGVDKNGNIVAASAASVWQANNIGGTTIGFCATCAAGGNDELIVGGPNSSMKYTGNGAIGPAHSPFIIGSNATYASGALATLDTSPSWVMGFNGITATSPVVISNVIFGFGTGTNYGTDFYTMATYTELDAPEPESNIMVVTGLGLVLLAVVVKRQQTASNRK